MSTSQNLQFRHDGTFKIVQFTDVHWAKGREKDQQTNKTMNTVLDAEQPDFVLFTGDLIYAVREEDGKNRCDNPIEAMQAAILAVTERQIPWAIVFGNHDTEHDITREQLMDAVCKQPYTLAEAGPDHIHGTGNYVLPITGSDGNSTAALLYALDSGDYSSHPHTDGYAWIRPSQVNWYIEQSKAWTDHNNGQPLPALAFFHIPLPEYDDMWRTTICYGHKHERVCAARINSGFFSALLEQNDVMGTFCGHDHINDYWGEYCGIKLHYGRATGYNTYGREDMVRGARVILMKEGERNFSTWLRLGDGSKIETQPEHVPETSN